MGKSRDDYKLEVDADNVLRLWDLSNPHTDEPFILQPNYPNNIEWTAEQARAWGEAFIEAHYNPESAMVAGYSPEEPVIPRPIDYAKLAKEKLIALGFTEEEARAITR